MGTELRVAERQGLLTGRHLSPVQFAASVALDWLEQIRSTRRQHETDLLRVKAALVASAHYKPEVLFADYFDSSTSDEDEAETEGALDVSTEEGKKGVDYSGVEFKGGEAIAEYEQLMAEVAAASQGSLSGEDVLKQKEWV